MRRARRRERDVAAKGCCHERTRIVIASTPDPGTGGWWAARCAVTRKDFDDDHADAATRARLTMIGCVVRIGGVVHCRRIDRRHWSCHQLSGARDVGLAAGAGQQPVMPDAMKLLGQDTWSRKRLMNSSALSVIVRYRACPLRW